MFFSAGSADDQIRSSLKVCEKIYEFVCCNVLQCVAMASRGYTLVVVR